MFEQHLSQMQMFGLVGFGLTFWASGVLAIRHGGPTLFANNITKVLSYIAVVPLTYGMIFICEMSLGIPSRYRLVTTCIATLSAISVDAVVLMWYPTLYENPALKKKNAYAGESCLRMGGAWLLWGVAVALGIGLRS